MNDAGKISFLPKGEYDSGAMYEALDVVKYDGMVWVAKKSSKGITPAEGENWMCLLTAADYATADAPGIVKPDGDTIEVSTDATISVSSKALTFADHDTATSGTSFTDAEDGNMLVTDWTKNLLNPTLESCEENGIKCTRNPDGTYTLNGTAISDAYFYFISNSNKEKYKNLKNVKACGRNDDQNCEMYIIDSNGTYYGIGNNGAIINQDIDSFFVKIFKGTTFKGNNLCIFWSSSINMDIFSEIISTFS